MLTSHDNLRAAVRDLESLSAGAVTRDVPLRRHCTWRIGGPADVMVEPASVDSLGRTIAYLHKAGMPWLTLGGGSNLLFPDAGLRGVVVKLGRAFSRVEINGSHLRVEAGKSLCKLAHTVAAARLGGLEKLVGVPGTVGGLVTMNGGCYGSCISDHLVRLTAFTSCGERLDLPAGACQFRHRGSRFLHTGEVVAQAEFSLPAGDTAVLRQIMLETLRMRRAKFPLKQPNCGSVFFCTPEIFDAFGPPGRIVESIGAKGWRVGDAQVSERHANFIVNLGNATAGNVLELIARVRAGIREKYNIVMPCEVRLLNETGQIITP